MAIKIDGGMIGADNKPQCYYTPGVVLDLAVCAAGLDGAEHAAFGLCKIHAYGFPQFDKSPDRNHKARKSNNPRLSKNYIATHIGYARSTGYDAVDSLVRRRLLVLVGNNTIIINKWVDEWLDKNNRRLFDPETRAGRDRLAMVLDNLDRQDYWQFPASQIRSLLPPKGHTRQIAFQSGTPDEANDMPSGQPDTDNDETSGQPDTFAAELSGTPDNKSGTPDTQRPRKAENAQENRRLDVNRNEDTECPSGEAPLAEFPDLAAMLRALPRGDEVCAKLGGNGAPKFARISWLTAIRDYANNPSPDTIRKPAGYIIQIARAPSRARFAFIEQEPLTGQEDDEKPKAAYEVEQPRPRPVQSGTADKPEVNGDESLADQFMARPSAEQTLAVDQLRKSQASDRAGDKRRIYGGVLDRWLANGPADWRASSTGSARAQLVNAMAAGEQALRAYHQRVADGSQRQPAYL
jgi:hypothetical protein